MPKTPQRRQPRILLYGAAAFVATFLVFAQVLAHEFVNWDDNVNFIANPAYRGLGPDQIRWMFTTFHLGPYQPLAWLTLGFDYEIWGMDARGYHLTSLLLHALNAFLFVLVAFQLYRLAARGASGVDAAGAAGAALTAGLFFAIHPQRVESVAWITERRDVVSGAFFLLAILTHLASVQAAVGPERNRLARLALLAYLGSLLGKATGVTAPLVLLLLDGYPLRRFQGGPARMFTGENRKLWLEKLPWFCLALAFGIVALVGQGRSGALKSVEAFGVADRIGLTLYAAGFYLYKMVLPVGLSPLYEWTAAFDPYRLPAILLTLLPVVLTVAFFVYRKRWPAGFVAFLAFLFLIAPVSGAARAGNQVAADRYTYLATMPWALVAGAAWFAVRPDARTLTRLGQIAAVFILAGLTFVQSGIWRNSVTLWTQAVRVDRSSDRALINLASAYVDAQQLDQAAAIYTARLAENPKHADARYSLGMVYYMTGEVDRAEAEFSRLASEQPDFPMGHYGLGIVLMGRGRNEEAKAELESALKLAPGLHRAREALAQIEAR